MSTTLTLTDRLRRWSYLQDVELWLDPMPGRRRREVIRDLRANLADAASDVGMRRAIDDLGRPRALARAYVDGEPRRRPIWTVGVLAAGGVLLLAELVLLGYLGGMTDALLSSGGGTGSGSFFGVRVTTVGTADEMSWSFVGWSWPITIAALLAFLLGSRGWRLLAPRG